MSGASLQTSIPRISLIWLLVAQALVIIPHLTHLPLWITALWLACGVWRMQIFRMRAGYPNRLGKVALMLLAGAGVLFSRGTLLGLDAAVVLLIAAFVLKLVELRSQRDALVLIFLGFFCVVTAYLFDDSLTAAAYSFLPVSALLAALIGLQQSHLAMRPWPTLRLALSLLAQALPLLLLLFVFFPRLGPLWALPNPSNKALTGLSESMTPADIAELSKSDELVFTATFDGPPPARTQLYWRALSLEHFDGRRWTQAPQAQRQLAPQWTPSGQPWQYSVLAQASGRNWLFALDVAQSTDGGVLARRDFSLEYQQPLDQAMQYQVRSWPQAVRDGQVPLANLTASLQLPAAGDPRSRAWAAELRAEHSTADALVQALLVHFNREPYGYTLKPPPVGRDSIDEFLFRTRRGFCAHYAGAMTFVLRAAGIPARVVAGYQGGELNSRGNFFTVRQFDAHAWVEYWQPGTGWSSVDPTFAVAPERIEQGLEQALSGEQSFLADSPLSPLRYRQVAWLSELRQSWESLNDGWQRWVLGYQGAQQLQLLQGWFGRMDAQLLGLALVGGGALLLSLLALYLFKPWRRQTDPLRRQFQHFEQLLSRHGLPRETGEGPRDYAARAARRLPAQAFAIQAFAQNYEAQQYALQGGSSAALRQHLRNLRRALPWRLTRSTDESTDQ